MKPALLLSVLLLFYHDTLALRSYSGYKVFKTRPMPRDMMGILVQLVSKEARFDFWSPPHVNQSFRAMVEPAKEFQLDRQLQFLDFAPELIIDDLQKVLDRENLELERLMNEEPLNEGDVTFKRYMEYTEIKQHIEILRKTYVDVASPIHLALSTEGRFLPGIKLSSGPGKRAIWLSCGMQAREWMSPVICLWTITEVLANPMLLRLADWYILPVANPDGYVYSWEQDRFWRKTRGENVKSNCTGSDPNRNFDHFWNKENVKDPCSPAYPGSAPLSEQETMGISDLIHLLGTNGKIILYLNVQNYGQAILYPWGHTTDPAPTVEKLQEAAKLMSSAIKASGNITYAVGSTGDIIFIATGTGEDYAYSEAKIPYSFTLELPVGDQESFNLPPSSIVHTAKSLFAGIKTLVEHVINVESKPNIRDDL